MKHILYYVMLAWNPGEAPEFEAEAVLSVDPCTYRGPRYQDVPVAFSCATAYHWMGWHTDMHACSCYS